MNITETTPGIPPDLAASLRQALDNPTGASMTPKQPRRPANEWTAFARRTGGSSASRTLPSS